MNRKKNTPDYFDDDFEVTYTDELPDISLDFDDTDDYEADDGYSHHVRGGYDTDRSSSSRSRQHSGGTPRSARRRRSAATNLASPIGAPVRTGTKFLEKLTYFVLRPAPILLAAVITLITIVTFWSGHTAYGEPDSIVQEQNLSLAAYLAVGGILVLWETCSFLFALSGLWSGRIRGISFFILVYVGSYIASLANGFIPEDLAAQTGFDILNGIKDGLFSYGSLYPMFFPLCIAGLAACIFRRITED